MSGHDGLKVVEVTMHDKLATLGFFIAAASPAVASATPPLDLPWGCGETYTTTQAHGGASHTGDQYWAWDFGLKDGDEVVAVADGVIRQIKNNSTEYGCSSAFAHDGNYVVLDFEDGTEALYLHLKAGTILVNPGDRVVRGQALGQVGSSGWICGVHLHFQVQRTCSSWFCPAIQSGFDMIGDPRYQDRLTSSNCGMPVLCDVAPGEELVIDDQDVCFRRVTQYWWAEAGGHGGEWQYTWAIDAAMPDTQGWWKFEVQRSGEYDVSVHVPAGAQSRRAKYYVGNGSIEHGPFALDQSVQVGWVRLGEVWLDAGVESYVNLRDNTGEPYVEGGSSNRKLAFDAVKIGPVTQPMPDSNNATPEPGNTTPGPNHSASEPEHQQPGTGNSEPEPVNSATPGSGNAMPGGDNSMSEPMNQVTDPVSSNNAPNALSEPGSSSAPGEAVDMPGGAQGGEEPGGLVVGEGGCQTSARAEPGGRAGSWLMMFGILGGIARRRRRSSW